jgi:hypothetical protein
MAKDFASKLKKDTRAIKEQPTKAAATATAKETTTKATKTITTQAAEPKKVGRPKVKTEECKTVNIAIPVSVLEKIEIAKAKYHDNMTEYINAVIAKDLESNLKDYKKIYDLINN